MMLDDFYKLRRNLTPREPAPPTPTGWNPDGTYTGNPVRPAPGVDPLDTKRGRNPYPAKMPSLGETARLDRHMALVHHYAKRAFEEGLLIAGGEQGLPPELRRGEAHRRAELRQAILRRKAILEELGTGVVVLTDEEQAIVDGGDEPEAAAA
jgi:hypothetical protein